MGVTSGHHKEVFHDTVTPTDTRGTRASQLFREHRSLLHPHGRELCTVFQAEAGSIRSRADPPVSSSPVSRSQTRPQHRGATGGGAPVLLRPDARTGVEPGSSALPEETAPTAQHPLSTGGQPSDRRRRQRLPSHDRDDAVCHRRAPIGTDPARDRRHRFGAHGRARSQRQGRQGP